MSFTIHHQVLLATFIVAFVMGVVANKTRFCIMGAISDRVIMGDSARLCAWGLSIAVALTGVLVLEATGLITLDSNTFPPYRAEHLAWLRHLLGGLMFGVGMTLASGCINRNLVRIGGGNLKSLIVLVVVALATYLMVWADFDEKFFGRWINFANLDLAGSEKYTIENQEVGKVLSGVFGLDNSSRIHFALGALIVTGLAAWILIANKVRDNRDLLVGGLIIGLAVVAGWLITGSSMGLAWKAWAAAATVVPSRVETQSFNFVSPTGDLLRYLLNPTKLAHINFGIMALLGVMVGSYIYAKISRTFRVEWFASIQDLMRHLIGAALMGVGGVLAMGCTIGQPITGISTLALGAFISLIAMVVGAIITLKCEYWRA